MYPRVKFVKMKKEDNVDIIKWALTQDDSSMNIRDMTLSMIPELVDAKDVDKVLSNAYDSIIPKLNEVVIKYQTIWDKINNSYFKELKKLLNIKWQGKESIVCDVGLLPVSPRYIDDCSFSINYTLDDKSLINIVSHEVLHFYWFMKFKEVFPNIKREEYDFPYLPWKYSELVTEAILNSKSIYNITNTHEKCCYNFDRSTIEKISNIFNDNNLTIEEKIIEGYNLLETTEE